MNKKAIDGITYGVTDQVIYATDKNITKEYVMENPAPSKEALGEGGRSFAFKDIAQIELHGDKKKTLFVRTNEDGLRIHTGSEEEQERILNEITSKANKSGELTTKRAGIFATSGLSVLFTILASLVTWAGYILASTPGADAVDISGKNARAKEMVADVSTMLGPIGTLIVGGLITLYFVRKAYVSKKNAHEIKLYSL